jgi:hypothetical protein
MALQSNQPSTPRKRVSLFAVALAVTSCADLLGFEHGTLRDDDDAGTSTGVGGGGAAGARPGGSGGADASPDLNRGDTRNGGTDAAFDSPNRGGAAGSAGTTGGAGTGATTGSGGSTDGSGGSTGGSGGGATDASIDSSRDTGGGGGGVPDVATDRPKSLQRPLRLQDRPRHRLRTDGLLALRARSRDGDVQRGRRM